MGAVLVANIGDPLQRLMGWFLRDSGLDVDEVDGVDAALQLLRAQPVRALLINSRADVAEIAAAVRVLRAAVHDARIIVLHRGRHERAQPAIEADLCIHDVEDPDYLVDVVRAALADQIPEGEPHDVAEALE